MRTLTVTVLLLACAPAYAQMYKCVDPRGATASRTRTATSGSRSCASRLAVVRDAPHVAMPRLSACSSPPRVAHRRGEKNRAEKNFCERKGLGDAALGPGAGHAFGEVAEHQHARPLVGVAPAAQDSRRREDERQHLQRHERSARTKGREP